MKIERSPGETILGTANQITVADNGDGTYTLSTPQNLHTAAAPTFDHLTLSTYVTLTGQAMYPAAPAEGWIVRLEGHATLDDGLYVYNGSAWVVLRSW